MMRPCVCGQDRNIAVEGHEHACPQRATRPGDASGGYAPVLERVVTKRELAAMAKDLREIASAWIQNDAGAASLGGASALHSLAVVFERFSK